MINVNQNYLATLPQYNQCMERSISFYQQPNKSTQPTNFATTNNATVNVVTNYTRLNKGWANYNGKNYYVINTSRLSGYGGRTKNYAICATGAWKISSKYYYFNNAGALQKSNPNNGVFKSSDGKTYCIETTKSSDGYQYYLVTNTWKETNGKSYYLGNDGVAYTGVKVVGGLLYYFNDNGTLQETDPIDGVFKAPNEKVYYVETTENAGGYQYYIANNEWKTINNKSYFFTYDGSAQIGESNINGLYYYFNDDGTLQKSNPNNGVFFASNGKIYCVETTENSKGDQYYLATNVWKKVNDKSYYLSSDGSAYKNGTFTIDGVQYRFDNAGVCTAVRRPSGWSPLRH